MLAYTDVKTDDGLLHLGDYETELLHSVEHRVTAGQSPTFAPVLGCCYSLSSSNHPLGRVAKSECNRPDPMSKAARRGGGFVSCIRPLAKVAAGVL